MNGSGCSLTVHGPINQICVAASAAIIIRDPGPAPQTVPPYRPIQGI
jgi:hypothetical protein